MAYTTEGITIVSDIAQDMGRLVGVRCGLADKVVQAYVAGQLQQALRPVGGACEFFLHDVGETELLFFLAVDPPEADTNYWPAAFPELAAHGNRLRVRLPQWRTYSLHDVVEIHRGQAGQTEADILVHRQDMFPNGRGAAGWGLGGFGRGGYGYDGANCPGFGWGYGHQYGLGCEFIEAATESLPPGRYVVRAIVTDAVGNESAPVEQAVTLSTYPRPAGELRIERYESNTDTIGLAWTASPDL
ncbi:MAG: hypothetical protein NTV86_13070 [Planctomycetota bacterium]|nr:hypothetical protein [Planctomycetota bacterium]